MAVLRLAVLLQGLLFAARCEVRARDPEVEDEDLTDMSDGAGWTHEVPLVGFGAPHNGDGLNKSPDVYGAIHHPLDHKHPNHGQASPDVPVSPTAKDASHGSLQRTGNWCAFVHKHAVSVAVACGTEKYVIKSQSPCPNGTPDCQIVMYKISTRPVYRQKEKIYTALQWRCCPGHAGVHCEETVTDGPVSEDPNMSIHPHSQGHENSQGLKLTGQHHNREQNDFQMLGSPLYEAQRPDAENQTTAESIDNNENNTHTGHEHHRHQDFERRDPYDVHEGIPHPETSYLYHGLLPILKEAVFSQLQPVLENFNLTLERLFQEVQELQHDMAQLRHPLEQKRVSEPLEFESEDPDQQKTLPEELKKTIQKLEEVKAQFHTHRSHMEEKIHAQHSMLLYNMTVFKTDMDLKIKRNQKMLQVNLHSLNSSMAEIRQEQERLDEELQRVWPEKTTDPSQPHESTAIWEAITRLDNQVMNNTVGLNALTEGQEQVIQNIEDLQSGWRNLEETIAQTGREYQIKYMETGLEVDAAKVIVLDQIKELGNNISVFQGALQDMEIDVDYLFTQYYKNISTSAGDCNCLDFKTSVEQLERNVADVREIANENRLARISEAKMPNNHEDGAWIPSVEDLKLGLLNVQKSLAFEQEKSRMLQHNVTQLQISLLGSQQDIEALQERDRAKIEKIQQLASTFNTLLQDAIRHSEILEVLLGEEVMEFTEWSPQDQKQYSIPALRESIKDMQEQINGHSLSLASMVNPAAAAADEPSVLEDWASVGTKGRGGHQRFVLSEEQPEYSDTDFWTLEKTVKELGARIQQLGDRHCLSCCNCTKSAAGVEVRLEEEVATLRKNLEVHLEVFNSIFSNTERFVGSEASVDLDRLSALLKRKAAKQHNKKQTKRPKRWIPGDIRRRRDALLQSAELRQLSDTPFLFLVSTAEGANGSGPVHFERVALNHGQIYSPKTGTFHAPASGVYFFLVTIDFGPGPSLAQLKRGGDVVASLRQTHRKSGAPATRVCILQLEQGDELHLELLQGQIERGNEKDNTFAGLLMLQTT